MDEYLIPTQFGEAEFVEKKSRFIGRVWPVDTEEEALAKIQEMKKKHYDATHNCWAYIIRDGAVRFYERVRLEAAAFGGILRKTDFGAEVELELLFPEGQVSAFLEKLTDLSSGTVEGMETGQEYRAFPVETT